jgi:glycosidase
MNLVSSHDVARFITLCGEDEDKFLLGYAFLFMHIGIPCIYYGDEIGMNGTGDPKCRKCFDWNSVNWNQKIFAAMKLLIKIHKEKLINERDYHIDVVNDVVVVTRKSLQNSIILYMNLSGDTKNIPEEGKPLVGNKHHAFTLENKGFVIIEK